MIQYSSSKFIATCCHKRSQRTDHKTAKSFFQFVNTWTGSTLRGLLRVLYPICCISPITQSITTQQQFKKHLTRIKRIVNALTDSHPTNLYSYLFFQHNMISITMQWVQLKFNKELKYHSLLHHFGVFYSMLFRAVFFTVFHAPLYQCAKHCSQWICIVYCKQMKMQCFDWWWINNCVHCRQDAA